MRLNGYLIIKQIHETGTQNILLGNGFNRDYHLARNFTRKVDFPCFSHVISLSLPNRPVPRRAPISKSLIVQYLQFTCIQCFALRFHCKFESGTKRRARVRLELELTNNANTEAFHSLEDSLWKNTLWAGSLWEGVPASIVPASVHSLWEEDPALAWDCKPLAPCAAFRDDARATCHSLRTSQQSL